MTPVFSSNPFAQFLPEAKIKEESEEERQAKFQHGVIKELLKLLGLSERLTNVLSRKADSSSRLLSEDWFNFNAEFPTNLSIVQPESKYKGRDIANTWVFGTEKLFMRSWPIIGLMAAEETYGRNNLAFVTRFNDYRRTLVAWRKPYVNMHDCVAEEEGILLRRLGDFVYALEDLGGLARRVSETGWSILELGLGDEKDG